MKKIFGKVKEFFVNLGHNIKKETKFFFKKKKEDYHYSSTWFKTTTIVVSLASIISLAMSNIYIEGIYQLRTSLCGIAMFIYILLGLICIFMSIRTKEGRSGQFYLTIACLLLTIIVGGWLGYELIMGIGKKAKDNLIISALVLDIVIMIFYMISIGLLLYSSHFEAKELGLIRRKLKEQNSL